MMMCRSVKMLAATAVAVVGLAAGAWAQEGPTTCPVWVEFNATGGTITTPAGPVVNGRYESLPTPVKDGFNFRGWFTAEMGGNEVTTSTVFEGACNVPDFVYAQWEPVPNLIPARVMFDPTGGTVTPTEATTVNGKLASLPTPERPGYTFRGWFTAAEGGDEVTTSKEFGAGNNFSVPDYILYAQWREEPPPVIGYPKITFNANGGTVTPTTITIDNAYGIIGPLPTPKRTGYIFNGWFTAATGGYLITAESKFLSGENAVVYAQWTAAPAVWDVGVETGKVTAKLSEDGTLTVSGSGAMADFVKGAHLGKAAASAADGRTVPWYGDNVKKVVVENGVTSVGENAFDGCVNLISVTIGKDVASIGAGAFSGSSALASISYMGEAPPSIASSAFTGVDMASVSLYVPKSAEGVYETAGFGNIKGYTSVTVPRVSRAKQFSISQNGSNLRIVGTSQATPVRIYDMRGRLLMSHSAMPNEVISVSNLARGTYLVKALGNSVRIVR